MNTRGRQITYCELGIHGEAVSAVVRFKTAFEHRVAGLAGSAKLETGRADAVAAVVVVVGAIGRDRVASLLLQTPGKVGKQGQALSAVVGS